MKYLLIPTLNFAIFYVKRLQILHSVITCQNFKRKKSHHKTRNKIWHKLVNLENSTYVVDFDPKSNGGHAIHSN